MRMSRCASLSHSFLWTSFWAIELSVQIQKGTLIQHPRHAVRIQVPCSTSRSGAININPRISHDALFQRSCMMQYLHSVQTSDSFFEAIFLRHRRELRGRPMNFIFRLTMQGPLPTVRSTHLRFVLGMKASYGNLHASHHNALHVAHHFMHPGIIFRLWALSTFQNKLVSAIQSRDLHRG